MKKILLLFIALIVSSAAWASDNTSETTLYGTMYYTSYGSHTASGDRVNAARVKAGKDRWVALSRDMFRAGFKMNDTILVNSTVNPMVNGLWVVKDKMAGRKKIDFLVHRSNCRGFRNGKVTIRKMDAEDLAEYRQNQQTESKGDLADNAIASAR